MNNSTQASQWVFRHAGGALIDTPDLPPPPPRGHGLYRWTATLWHDSTHPDRWAALEWVAAPRGWWLPNTLAIGDIVEFGVTWTGALGRRHTHRWFGWLERATPLAVIVTGPYPCPEDAEAAARPRVDELRLAQLAPPGDDRLTTVMGHRWDD